MKNILNENCFNDIKINMENDLTVLFWWKIDQWIELAWWSLWQKIFSNQKQGMLLYLYLECLNLNHPWCQNGSQSVLGVKYTLPCSPIRTP